MRTIVVHSCRYCSSFGVFQASAVFLEASQQLGREISACLPGWSVSRTGQRSLSGVEWRVFSAALFLTILKTQLENL